MQFVGTCYISITMPSHVTLSVNDGVLYGGVGMLLPWRQLRSCLPCAASDGADPGAALPRCAGPGCSVTGFAVCIIASQICIRTVAEQYALYAGGVALIAHLPAYHVLCIAYG